MKAPDGFICIFKDKGGTCKVWMNDTAPDNWCSDGMVEMRDDDETD